MNKTTTRPKVASKTKTTKTVKSAATKAKTTKSRASAATTKKTTTKKAVATKKPVAKKGLLHHVKRIHRLTPKFVHGMLVGAVVGLGMVSWIGSTGHASANPTASACIKTSGIKVNDVNANTDIKLDKNCGNRKFVMKAWYADSASGEPHDTQRLFAQSDVVRVQDTDNNATHINVKMPAVGCFYQVDLVDVTKDAQGDGYPIADHKTGGNRNCNPTPAYACSALHAVAAANRQVTIDQFTYTAKYATFTRASVNWGDGSNPVITPNVIGSQHAYAKDGSYTLSVVAYFMTTAQNGEAKEKAAAACSFPITITTATPPVTPPTTPGTQQVCELKTGKTVAVPEGAYDTNLYGPTTAKECNPTPTVPTTPVTPTTPGATPTSTLVKTGPGAILIIFALAAIGGYVTHHGHRHLTSKKNQKRA